MTTHRFFLPLSLLMLTAVLGPRHDARGQSKEQTVGQLATRAEVVAVGTVTDLRSEWNVDRTRISTQVTLTVDQYLKGNMTGPTLTLTVPGGEVDDVGELYSHVPRFSQNEAVVVFAQADEGGTLRVTGGEQGKISVRQDERSGRMLVGQGEVLEAFTTRIKHAINSRQQD